MHYGKILKSVLIGLAVCGITELTFEVGKGYMLGILCHYNAITPEAMADLSAGAIHTWPLNVIMGTSIHTQQMLSEKSNET